MTPEERAAAYVARYEARMRTWFAGGGTLPEPDAGEIAAEIRAAITEHHCDCAVHVRAGGPR